MFATERLMHDPCINDDHSFVGVSSVSNETVLRFTRINSFTVTLPILNEGL